jgi:hypothetical protein
VALFEVDMVATLEAEMVSKSEKMSAEASEEKTGAKSGVASVHPLETSWEA